MVHDSRRFQLQGCSSWAGPLVPVQRSPQPLCGESMTSLVQIFRFLVGLGMVAAGGFVAAPFISSVLSTASREVVTQTPCQQSKPFDRDKTTQSIPNSFRSTSETSNSSGSNTNSGSGSEIGCSI